MARILIIEDEELVRFSLADTILLAGHEVLEARNGQEGLKVLDEEKIDIVITDIIMPVMEGVQTTIEIRRSHPSLKIIAISGGGRAKNMQYLNLAKHYGADFILKKPFSNEELIRSINKCIE